MNRKTKTGTGFFDWLNSILGLAIIGGAATVALSFASDGASVVPALFREFLIGNFMLHLAVSIIARWRGVHFWWPPVIFGVALFFAMSAPVGLTSVMAGGVVTLKQESWLLMLVVPLMIATTLAVAAGWTVTLLQIAGEVKRTPPVGWSRRPNGVLVRQLATGGHIERDLFFVFREFDPQGGFVRKWTDSEDVI